MNSDRVHSKVGASERAKQDEQATAHPCGAIDPTYLLNRRHFLFGMGAVVTSLSLPGWMARPGLARTVQAQVAQFTRQPIARLSELETGDVLSFTYPWDHPLVSNFLVKLGERAGGGVGPDEDIVAFNSYCTHQGGPLAGAVKPALGVVGPCPLHWTTFDLTRHGMVVTGHATMGLPQIILELEGDDIVATGVMGLIFGLHDNAVNPAG